MQREGASQMSYVLSFSHVAYGLYRALDVATTVSYIGAKLVKTARTGLKLEHFVRFQRWRHSQRRLVGWQLSLITGVAILLCM